MRISDMIAICWRNLTRRKLRTALTAFGVVIGVCSIIVMISIGIGLEASFTAQLESFGDLTMIEVNNYGGTKVLNDEAVQKMQAIPGVEIATPLYQSWEINLMMRTKNKRYQASPQLYGIYPEALEKMGYVIESGNTLKDGDKDYSVVIGSNFAYRFRDTKKKPGRGDRVDPYPDQNGVIKKPFLDPQKEKLQIVLHPSTEKAKEIVLDMHVAGMMKPDDSKWETKEYVFMDISEMKALVNKYNKENGKPKVTEWKYEQVKVKCTDLEQVAAVQAVIKDEMGFDCWSMESTRQSMQQTAQMIQMVLGGLAAISLFVAAIGIANTMVMSIIERTREIGIMKVIGAEVGNIRLMFLMESGMIGFLGGIVGVATSYGVSYLINTLSGGGGGGDSMLGGMFGMGGGTAISIIPPWLVGFALAFSILIGVIFGFLPANRAVKISALEAIKHD